MTFQFKIQLKDISKPPVWRRVLVPSNFNFYDLHSIIQLTMGWDDYHMFQFSPTGYGSYPCISDDTEEEMDDFFGNKRENLEAEETLLSDIFSKENQKFTYIYDFGDDWVHKITLEKILTDDIQTPQIITGKGQCPPEDCGGPWGYEELIQILNNPDHPEHKSYRDWMGMEDYENWDASYFNLKEVQEILQRAFTSNNED